jgi:hypothetical protein
MYTFDTKNPRRDWYEQPDGGWWEVYPDGTHSHLRVVSATFSYGSQTGHLLEKDDNTIQVFVPKNLTSADWLTFWKTDGSTTPFRLGQVTVYDSTPKAWNPDLGQVVQDLGTPDQAQQSLTSINKRSSSAPRLASDPTLQPGADQCGSKSPSALHITFGCTLIPHGQGPADVVFSMKNNSGCPVAVKGIGKITGTAGHIYTTNPPGASQSLGGHSDGYSFADTRTPFGPVLTPNNQEFPASCEIDNLVVCSATAPPGFPPDTYFQPFVAGKCAKLPNVGPVAFDHRSNASCGSPQSLDWTSGINPSPGQTISVRDLGSGVLIHKYVAANVTNKGNDDTTISYAAIGTVSVSRGFGTDWLLVLGVKDGATFPEHQDSGYNDGDYDSHGMQLYFISESALQEARAFFEYHRCLGK